MINHTAECQQEASMTTRTGYLAFLAEPPLVGLDPHPAWAPEAPASHDADGFFLAYGASASREALEREIAEDLRARLDAVAAGDLEDADEADVILAVRIHDDGRMEVRDRDHPEDPPLRIHQMSEIYAAFGLPVPRP